MRIGSILIGGVERGDATLIQDFQIIKETNDRMGMARMKVLYSPATIGVDDPLFGAELFGTSLFSKNSITSSIAIQDGQLVEIYMSGSESGEGGELFGEPTFGTNLFGEEEELTLIFAGEIVVCSPKMVSANPPVNMMEIEVRDWTGILDASPVAAATYASPTSDQAVINAAVAAAAPVLSTAGVTNTTTLTTFDYQDVSLRQLLERVNERTGAVYLVTPTKGLLYFAPGANIAAFSVSDEPDGVDSFAWERDSFSHRQEWRNAANQIKVVGMVGSGGVSITATSDDLTSQGLYGIKSATIVDRQIKSTGEATLRANKEVAERGNPQYGGTFRILRDGLHAGDLLTIIADASMNLSGAFLIRRITMRWLNTTVTEHEVEWGNFQPDVARTIRAIAESAKTDAPAQATIPAPGTVTGGSGGSIVTGTIEQINMANASIGSAQIINANILTAHVGDAQITNAKIVSLDAVKITTGDLVVGGSGHVGQVDVRNASDASFGWIGKNGTDYGAWFAQIRAAGTNWGDARFRIAAGGAVEIDLEDGDSIALTSTSDSFKTLIDNSGVYISDTSSASDRLLLLKDQAWLTASAGQQALMSLAAGDALVRAQDSSGSLVEFLATADYLGSAFVGVHWTSGVTISNGSGSPEGVITAVRGSLYLRNDGGSGTCLYVKESASGNTGWVAK